MNLQKYVKKFPLFFVGTNGITDPFRLASIIACNSIATVALTSMLLFALGFLFSKVYIAALIILLSSPPFFLIHFLNYKKLFRAARYYTSSLVLVECCIAILHVGQRSQLQIILLAVFSLHFLILLPDTKKSLYTFLALNFLLMLSIDLNPLGIYDGHDPVPQAFIIPFLIVTKSIVLAAAFIENSHKQIVYQKLTTKEGEIRDLLNNMNQAVFTINAQGYIQAGYSKFSLNIFSKIDLQNTNFVSDFVGKSAISPDSLEQIKSVLTGAVDEPKFVFDMNRHLLPNEIRFNNPAQIFDLDWVALVNANNDVQNIMINIRDISSQVMLKNETLKKDREIEIIRQILDAGNENYSNFIKSTTNYLKEAEISCDKLQKNTTSDPNERLADISALFRHLHTIKGNSRLFGFLHIVNSAHSAEEHLLEYKNSIISEGVLKEVKSNLKNLENVVQEYKSIYKENLERKQSAEVLDIYTLTKAFEEEATELVKETDLLKKTSKFIAEYGKITSKPIELILEPQIRGIQSLALSLNIPNPIIEITNGDIYFRNKYHSVLQDSINHIFRNSIDHGLRHIAPNPGKVSISVKKSKSDLIEIIIQDSGPGLSIPDIIHNAKEKKLIVDELKVKVDQIANCIFLPGFSTKKDVTLLSGRGVGMDFVKTTMIQHGCDVQLELLDRMDERGCQRFQILFLVPSKWAMSS